MPFVGIANLVTSLKFQSLKSGVDVLCICHEYPPCKLFLNAAI